MKKIILFLLALFISIHAQDFTKETKEQHNTRMQWWRNARFGMFIHWGLYAIPAGEWGNKNDYGEWIRTSAQIPLEQYDKFVGQFNPVKFNADEWACMAKDAGMKYIVITSKHHDGFQLFASKQSDFNVMSTPFKRDILKELADACRKVGIKICWYHSIMDWHHPDYLPRREWEKDRSTDGAKFERYVEYMKSQLKELLTNYGEISVLWFDGEWENTWNDKLGTEIYNYVRSLQPNIIINNRVGASRNGMEGFSSGTLGGDFGTPEQQIPATGLSGVDWETCMTMNDHWGYNKNDKKWKSAKEILQMLADIASKGGNYLLNVGPTSEGLFPPESIQRLKEIGNWMKVNGESIYGTQASPFKYLEWGRCTKKNIENDTRLYLHVFNWPANGELVVPGIYNQVKQSYLLSDSKKSLLNVTRKEDALIIKIPNKAPDEINSVIVLDVVGKADINYPPKLQSGLNVFVNELDVKVDTDRDNVQIKYTLDGTEPNINSPIIKHSVHLTGTSTIKVKCFRDGKPVSETATATFTKVDAKPSAKVDKLSNGILYKYFEGDWDKLPDFSKMKPVKETTAKNFELIPHGKNEYYGNEFTGYISIPKEDVYTFYTESDDGSQLFVDGELVVDNDGLHGTKSKEGVVALAKGYHPVRVTFFNKRDEGALKVYYKSAGIAKQLIPDLILFH